MPNVMYKLHKSIYKLHFVILQLLFDFQFDEILQHLFQQPDEIN